MPVHGYDSLTVVCRPDARVVEMRGTLDAVNADVASLYLEDLLDGVAGRVTLDLNGLDTLSPRGFDLIVSIRRRLAEHGSELEIHLADEGADHVRSKVAS
jgi:anti-anti-sigma regulatory factor